MVNLMGGEDSSSHAPIGAGLADVYKSSEEVVEALARDGSVFPNLIVGIDFTKSNEWTGTESFNRRSLHHIGDEKNPYEQTMSIVGKKLASVNENNLICCFGFGDATTRNQEVFSFYHDMRLCNGFEEVLGRYREFVPYVQLAGPTSFAPIIEMAITVVENSNGKYHVLLIIADGKADTLQEGRTFDAIVKASEYPLSIILVGVGDGPWDSMREFIDSIPARDFDNFQFVNFTEIMSKNMDQAQKEAEFSLACLINLPSQYKTIIERNLLGVSRGMARPRVPFPPPMPTRESLHWSNTIQRVPAPSSNEGPEVCTICTVRPVNMYFDCEHQICFDCGILVVSCPFCRCTINTRFIYDLH